MYKVKTKKASNLLVKKLKQFQTHELVFFKFFNNPMSRGNNNNLFPTLDYRL